MGYRVNPVPLIPYTAVYRWLTLLVTDGTAHKNSGRPSLFTQGLRKASVRKQEGKRLKQKPGRDLRM